MTDVFFSYSSKDRERVRRFKDGLEALGFSVFWDLETPTGKDWNSWIRENLDRARCVVVFWSAHSLASDPVKTEAIEAKRQGKLLPVQLDAALDMRKLPLGHDQLQFTDMSTWAGDTADPVWRRLIGAIEVLATPPWVLRKLAENEADLLVVRRTLVQAEASVAALKARVGVPEIRSQSQRDVEEQRPDLEQQPPTQDLDLLFALSRDRLRDHSGAAKDVVDAFGGTGFKWPERTATTIESLLEQLLRIDLSSMTIAELQKELTGRGFYRGPINGHLSRELIDALMMVSMLG